MALSNEKSPVTPRLLLAAWAVWIVTGALPAALCAAPPDLEFKEGERVVLLGATSIERMQTYNYFETALVAGYTDRNFIVRNLGWSGDNVFGRARARFGDQNEGFRHLTAHIDQLKPTVILVAYGANEAYAGAEGVEQFRNGLDKLLDALAKSNARLVLLGPLRREPLPRPLPDPTAYNATLPLYEAVLKEAAEKRSAAYIDLADLLPAAQSAASGPPAPLDQFTENGLHLSAYGDWRAGPQLAAKLGVAPARWEVEVDAAGKVAVQQGVEIRAVGAAPLRFTALDRRLPAPPVPRHAPQGADQFIARTLRVTGLAAGKYELTIDGQPVATATAAAWAAGVTLARGPEFDQAEALRQTINEKNVLFFHRWRPQNETYLFLFRKGEQGNNAVEIPMFDPLIAEKEAQIARLKLPVKHDYALKKVD